MSHHQIVIVGGGTAGITTAAQLLKKDNSLNILIIDPAERHYYQPAFTLVGGGTYDFENTWKPMKEVIPDDAEWLQQRVISIDPDRNNLTVEGGKEIHYDFLVVCPGIQMVPEAIPGLAEALETEHVCSIYTDPQKAWKLIDNFKGGTALFTQPATPIKCGGAPQKIAYLSEERFRENGVRDKTNVVYAMPGSVIFGVEPFKQTLMKVVERKDIHLRYFHELIAVDPKAKTATYRITKHQGDEEQLFYNRKALNETWNGDGEVSLTYDLLHVAPPQFAPDFILHSPLVATDGPQKGWVEVDKHSLRHKRYSNVFSLGDVAGLPTAKTGAAIRKQAPVVVENLLHLIRGENEIEKGYNGYSSCPIVTGYGKMLLAEFEYDNQRKSDPLLSRIFDLSRELYPMWLLKKYGLPYLYWHRMLKGKF